MDTVFYYTTTVLKDGTVNEDKGLYGDGLEHATKCQEKRMMENKDIDKVILHPSDGSNPIILPNKL